MTVDVRCRFTDHFQADGVHKLHDCPALRPENENLWICYRLHEIDNLGADILWTGRRRRPVRTDGIEPSDIIPTELEKFLSQRRLAPSDSSTSLGKPSLLLDSFEDYGQTSMTGYSRSWLSAPASHGLFTAKSVTYLNVSNTLSGEVLAGLRKRFLSELSFCV